MFRVNLLTSFFFSCFQKEEKEEKFKTEKKKLLLISLSLSLEKKARKRVEIYSFLSLFFEQQKINRNIHFPYQRWKYVFGKLLITKLPHHNKVPDEKCLKSCAQQKLTTWSIEWKFHHILAAVCTVIVKSCWGDTPNFLITMLTNGKSENSCGGDKQKINDSIEHNYLQSCQIIFRGFSQFSNEITKCGNARHLISCMW